MSTLTIQLLGDFHIAYGDEPILNLPQARPQALLTYLLLHRHAPQARRHLAFLLWPDSSEPQALTNLRKALTHLRQTAPILAQSLYTDHQVVQWRPSIAVTLDVAVFETKLGLAMTAEQAGRVSEASTLWSAAVALYAGALSPSCYDDWLLAERERLHQLCLGALERLISSHERQQDHGMAILYAQQLLRHDPLQETTYLQLMRLQALQGDRAGALRTYHTCVTLLERELDIEPAPETQEAYARLLNLNTGATATTHVHRVTHLVGRQSEWEKLQRTWRLVTEQQAHFVCLWGEAGIGKSHLAEALLGWAGQQGFTVARTRSFAGEGSLAYAPVIEWLRTASVRTVWPRLAPVWLSEVARLIPEILTEQPSVPAPNPMTEPWQRQRLWEALARVLLAASQPLLLVIDDLQWCDQETLEWLHYLLHFAPRTRLLVLGTARPEEVNDAHPLQSLYRHLRTAEQLTEIALGPLGAEQTAQLATYVAQQPLDDYTQQALYHATAGNPLFVVEMVRAGFSKRQAELPYALSSLPPKVQAVIQTRLTQLSPTARELTRLAAVIGQDFTFELLLQASGHTEDSVVHALDELWQRRIIREHRGNTYDFSHDRIRDVAYAEVSPIRLRQLHRSIARALEVLYGNALDSVSSQLAVHYDKAGATIQAMDYYQRAATVAQRLFAYIETIVYLNRLLHLLDSLPQTPESNEHKLDTLLLLGRVLIKAKGYTAVEVETTYNQARLLCEVIDNIEKRLFALGGLAVYWRQRCNWSTADALEATMVRLAQQTQKVLHLQAAFQNIGGTLVHQGKFKAAYDYIYRAASLYDPEQYRAHLIDYSQVTGVDLLCGLSEISWLLGYPDQAQTTMDEALALARKLAQPFEILFALDFAIELAYNQRQRQTVQALVEEYQTLVAKHPFPYHVAEAMIYHGWLLAQTENADAGIDLIKQGLAAWGEQEILLYLPYYRAWLIDAYGWTNQVEQGLACLAETLALIEVTGEQFWKAELYRLKGELLLAQDRATAEVESCFQLARQVARQQEAKSLELRAATSLARLWQQQGRFTTAHQMLSEIYHWFTEGFDTPDLQITKALLSELEAAL